MKSQLREKECVHSFWPIAFPINSLLVTSGVSDTGSHPKNCNLVACWVKEKEMERESLEDLDANGETKIP